MNFLLSILSARDLVCGIERDCFTGEVLLRAKRYIEPLVVDLAIVSLFAYTCTSVMSAILFAEPLLRSRKTLNIRIVLVSISEYMSLLVATSFPNSPTLSLYSGTLGLSDPISPAS